MLPVKEYRTSDEVYRRSLRIIAKYAVVWRDGFPKDHIKRIETIHHMAMIALGYERPKKRWWEFWKR